jgi:adenine-specific DNA-methyltransferase
MKLLTPEDSETKSADILKENVAALEALFPEAFTEGRVNFDVLKQLLGEEVDERDEKYGLNWHGKRRARQIALTPSTGTLRPCPEDSEEWDTTQNLMIEGDNLEVLKLLQKSYAGKVKLIYIDPPYNTGKDFVYLDNFQDNIKNYLELTGQVEGGNKISSNTEASGRFHTDWLNMMYPRLKVARDLLQDDGLIFISCDDCESANVRKACDEIFGEENFIDTIVWKKRYGGGAKEKYLVSIHEYIAVYAKSIDAIGPIDVPLSEASIDRYYTLRDEYVEERGPYRTHPLEAMKSFEDRPNLSFGIHAPDGTEVWPKRQWRWSRERMDEAIANGEVAFVKTRNGEWAAYSKQYLKDDSGDTRSAKVFSIIDGVYTQAGTNEIVEYFGDARVFPFPKPSKLIKKLVELGSSEAKDDLIVDFFAGSGTSGDAVFAQNVEDGGTRRVILVQLPEPLDRENKDQKAAADYCDKLGKPRNIAELTKERLRRAAKKIKAENPMFASDLGFRVFKLASSNIRAWEPDRENLGQTLLDSVDHLKTDRSEPDILYELLLKLGLDLTVPMKTQTIAGHEVHSIGAGTLVVCLATKITAKDIEPLALGIADWHKAQNPAGESTVVFRDSAFADDVAKTNLTAILEQHGLENVRSL